MCEAALTVAIAFVLSYFEISLWFQGGSIDLVMIPIVLFAVRYGAGWGVAIGLIYGTLKFFSGGWAINWQSMLLDYSLAYAALGLGGLCRNMKHNMIWGSVVGGVARFIVHFISGVTIYAIVAPTVFWNMTFTSPTLYSLVYNGTYMLPNIIFSVIICPMLAIPLKRYIDKNKA